MQFAIPQAAQKPPPLMHSQKPSGSVQPCGATQLDGQLVVTPSQVTELAPIEQEMWPIHETDEQPVARPQFLCALQ
ncbi:MAG TPA: hypothetical protein VNJ70_11665 [Thermoanaerobaculia bacterium]|nr:hypothetical protein [Thermoanaerobaculia bacterium]